MTKKVVYPIHKMGKSCGYDEYEDGSIKVAPIYSAPMTEARDARAAVDRLLQSVTEQCHKLLIPIVAAERRFWKKVAEDYSLDQEKYAYFYDYDNGKIRREAAAQALKGEGR